MKKNNDLRNFYILWSTQGLSQLGSSVTSFALTLWLYEKTGSALSTATLMICSYAPYVVMSILAGALADSFNKKKAILICDALAALSTVVVYVLFRTDTLQVWHLYAVNVFSGLMNTVQQPASEVAITLLVPRERYQKTSGLRSLSRSLISILNPLIATALYSFAGLDVVIAADLATFALAFLALLFFIRLPSVQNKSSDSVLELAKEGISYLRKTPLVLRLILFMSGVNLVASAFDAALPGFVIPNPRGGQNMLGIVTSCAGIAMVAGSLVVSALPKPKDRVKVIYLTMLFSLGSENFILSLSRSPVMWCIAQIIGWFVVPIMSANHEVVLRNTIPLELQGRVYACRNTLQFFTIPIGLFLGGIFVDDVCEPYMAGNIPEFLHVMFGTGKGSGAAMVIFILGVVGALLCLITGQSLKGYKYEE